MIPGQIIAPGSKKETVGKRYIFHDTAQKFVPQAGGKIVLKQEHGTVTEKVVCPWIKELTRERFIFQKKKK